MMNFLKHLRNILYIYLSINIIFGNWGECKTNLWRIFFRGVEAFPYLIFYFIIPFLIWYVLIHWLCQRFMALERHKNKLVFLTPYVVFNLLLILTNWSLTQLDWCLILWPIISITFFYLIYNYMNRPKVKTE